MLAIQPTSTGVGVLILTSSEIMHALYDLVYKVLDIDYDVQEGSDEPRDLMLQAFAYDIRHSFMDADYETDNGHPTPCSIRIIWPDILIYVMCLRQKAAYAQLNAEDQSLMKRLEDALKEAMWKYDPKGAKDNERLVQPLFDLNTDYLYLIQHELHNDYIESKPRKAAFRDLIFTMYDYLDIFGGEHDDIEARAKAGAKANKCSIRELKSASEYLDVKRW